jgi:steroid delta-isomerase-like uncharacterized protein
MLGKGWESLAREIGKIWNQGRLDLVDEVVAPDYTRHDPAFPGEIRGPEGFKQYVTAMLAPFPDAKVDIDDMFVGVAGDKAAMRWTFRGTHTGALMTIAPTGRQIALTGISVVRINEAGKMVECWDGYDSLVMLRQLGVAP